MKENIETFKKLWANKRSRALIKLGLYFVFLTLIVTMLKVPSENKVTLTGFLELESRTSYNITYQIKKDNEETTLTGSCQNKICTLNDNDKKYQLSDDKVYLVIDNYLEEQNEDSFIFQITKYNISKIKELLENVEPLSRTTYQDGSVNKAYEIETIKINVLEKNSLITSITIEEANTEIKIIFN